MNISTHNPLPHSFAWVKLNVLRCEEITRREAGESRAAAVGSGTPGRLGRRAVGRRYCVDRFPVQGLGWSWSQIQDPEHKKHVYSKVIVRSGSANDTPGLASMTRDCCNGF